MIRAKFIILAMILMINAGCNRGDTDFVFPEGYKGWVAYIANDSISGKEPRIIDGRAQVVFPEDGFYFSKLPIPKGRNNRFFTSIKGTKVKLSVGLNSNTDSLKLCKILPSQIGFSINSFREEGEGKKIEGPDIFLDYDVLLFRIDSTCEESDDFDSYMVELKKRLIANRLGNKLN